MEPLLWMTEPLRHEFMVRALLISMVVGVVCERVLGWGMAIGRACSGCSQVCVVWL